MTTPFPPATLTLIWIFAKNAVSPYKPFCKRKSQLDNYTKPSKMEGFEKNLKY